jgi:hypothetical protein
MGPIDRPHGAVPHRLYPHPSLPVPTFKFHGPGISILILYHSQKIPSTRNGLVGGRHAALKLNRGRKTVVLEGIRSGTGALWAEVVVSPLLPADCSEISSYFEMMEILWASCSLAGRAMPLSHE